MIKNYFKTAWRQLIKSKFYSLINIAGLSIGLAAGILILIWVNDELSFDRFHSKEAAIYKLENMAGTGPSREIWTNTTAPIGVLAKKELPEIKEVARLSYNGYYTQFRTGDKIFNETNLQFTDPSLFSMFDFKIIKGNAARPFADSYSVVMTEESARRYFGSADPIGKVITAEDNTPFTVSGIIAAIPENSSIKADLFFSMDLLAKKFYAKDTTGKNLNNDFNQFNYDTYLLIPQKVNFDELSKKIRDIHLSNKPEDVDVAYLFLPLAKMHLYKSDGSDNGISTVRTFTLIALVILIVACINYVNLSTARALLRSKEVSMRKIAGAGRGQLFFQFTFDTLLLFLAAGTIALCLVAMLLPYFNQLSGKQLVFSIRNMQIWKIILLTTLGTLCASSIYPALLLSSFQPVKALKGKVAANVNDKIFRKVLVIVQFSFSIILITGTLIVTRQLNYIRNKNLGFDREHVFVFNMRDIAPHKDAVMTELLKAQGVADVTWGGSNIIDIGGQTGNNDWSGKEKGETLMLSPMAVDKHFIPFFNLKLQSGQGFTGSVADSLHYILNETAIKAARIKDPVGKRFTLWGREGTIIGVVKDFHFSTMREKIRPLIFYYAPSSYGGIYVKTTGKEAGHAIAAAKKQWDQYNAGFPFSYSFLDESFDRLYKTEQREGILVRLFSAIAVIVSCLGLLGLATYNAEIRTKEIGVRKVLGAGVFTIVQLVAQDFVKLIFIAIVIAVPVAWYSAEKWLQEFAYRTAIGWSVFVFAGGIALLVALLTISAQALKAAMANPVKSLRNE